jgi:hypothetical protein
MHDASLLRAAAAVFFLNVLMTLEIPLTRMEWDCLLQLSPDALCLCLGVCLLARPGQSFRPAIYAALTLAVVFLKLFQSADRLVPLIFNRDFNLFLDSQRLPDLIYLFRLTRPPVMVMTATAGILAGTAALTWGVWQALKTLDQALASRSPAHVGIRLPAATLAVAVLTAAGAGSPPAWVGRAVLLRVADEVRVILNLDEIRARHRSSLEQAMGRAHQTTGNLEKLDRASVFLIVVESYGMSALSDPRHSEAVLPALRAAEDELRFAGFDTCSAYLTSPTFGGGSWLAHATLASGVRIESQIGHDLMLESNLIPLAGYFNRAGYHTVRVMPGTRWPWPEGSFYRYRQSVISPDFGYLGPAFGFAPMPDQFVLDWIARHLLQDRSGPLFVEVILSGSHAAFDVQASYVDDWDRIGDGAVFRNLSPVVFPVDWSELAQASSAYRAAIVHVIGVLKEFARRFLDGTELVLIVGDHQPAVELVGADQPWSVPVHIISGNPGFIREFTARGYTPGLLPVQALPHPGMETLFWDILEGFSTN